MRISLNTSKWYDRIWAALIFFTRLPFWRIYQPDKDAYAAVVEHWPLAGWLTGGVMAATIYLGSMVLPYAVALLLAIALRMLITGALHEDGLADFFDGFGGGGTDRQRILDIMKDSRIGTYGVAGIVLYLALLFAALYSLNDPVLAALTVLAADPYAKMVAAQIVMMMPYARTKEESKNQTVYRKFNLRTGAALALQGLLPMLGYLYLRNQPAYGPVGGHPLDWQPVIFIPCIVLYFLYLFIWRRLRGYTGDCCGALFLLVELSVYLTVAATLTPVLPIT